MLAKHEHLQHVHVSTVKSTCQGNGVEKIVTIEREFGTYVGAAEPKAKAKTKAKATRGERFNAQFQSMVATNKRLRLTSETKLADGPALVRVPKATEGDSSDSDVGVDVESIIADVEEGFLTRLKKSFGVHGGVGGKTYKEGDNTESEDSDGEVFPTADKKAAGYLSDGDEKRAEKKAVHTDKALLKAMLGNGYPLVSKDLYKVAGRHDT